MRVGCALPHDPGAAVFRIGGIGVKHLGILVEHHHMSRSDHPLIVRGRFGGVWIGVTGAVIAPQHISDACLVDLYRTLTHPGFSPFLPLLVEAHGSKRHSVARPAVRASSELLMLMAGRV